MKSFDGKKIILAITPNVKLYSCFEDNFKHIGFEVFTISFNNQFKYKSLKERLINVYKKILLNDRIYKKKLIQDQNDDEILKKISNTPNVDYSLTIRADVFKETTLKKILLLGSKNYAYQWDGLSRFPEVKKLIPLFDKFYVFDKKDLNEDYKTYLTTNFYFDCYSQLFNNKEFKYDFYTLCNCDKRIDKIISIFEILNSKGYKLKLILYSKPKKHLKKYTYITFIQEPISYYDNLINVANSKGLIDIQNSAIHAGLSFRIFESLGYNKKIITTNQDVVNYDFYNKNNIFYLTDNFNITLFEEFLDASYKEIDSSIKKKYSFTNWISNILEI